MANEFKVKNGIKFPDGTVQTTAAVSSTSTSMDPIAAALVFGSGGGGGAASGGGQYYGTAAVKAISYNSDTIGENITIPAGQNGLSAGPVTVSTGFTVTVNGTWTVV